MLEPGDQDLIARSEARPCIGLRDEVDALGRAADEDDLPCGVGVDEPTHPLACSLVRLRGGLAERVDAAVDICVAMRFVPLYGTQDRQRALRRSGAVEVYQGMAVHRPLKNGEVPPHALDIEHGRRRNAVSRHSHHKSSFNDAASAIWPARSCSIWRLSSGISIFETTSSRNVHLRGRCATSGDKPR